MTIEINLLPWREARRERRNRRFKQIVALAAILGIGSAWGVANFYQQRLDTQQQRNRYVQNQSQQLDRDIATLHDFRTTREQMLTQIQLIRELQFSRPQTVRVFNQLTRSLEDGVYYTKLSREGEVLRLTGKAQANRQVSDQMRALASMPVFGVPTLSAVESGDDDQRRFDLTVREVSETPPPGIGEAAKKEATP